MQLLFFKTNGPTSELLLSRDTKVQASLGSGWLCVPVPQMDSAFDQGLPLGDGCSPDLFGVGFEQVKSQKASQLGRTFASETGFAFVWKMSR